MVRSVAHFDRQPETGSWLTMETLGAIWAPNFLKSMGPQLNLRAHILHQFYKLYLKNKRCEETSVFHISSNYQVVQITYDWKSLICSMSILPYFDRFTTWSLISKAFEHFYWSLDDQILNFLLPTRYCPHKILLALVSGPMDIHSPVRATVPNVLKVAIYCAPKLGLHM